MPLRFAIFCTLLVLTGCTTRTEPAAPKARAARPAGVPGVILAMRPVPVENPEPARILFAGLGIPDDSGGGPPADANVFEFIVRAGDGTTIAIVQRQTHDLRPGAQVNILRGAETRIEAPAGD